jgi:hypothetical protein
MKADAAIAQAIVQERHPDQMVGIPRWSPFAGGFYTVTTSGGQELVSIDTINRKRNIKHQEARQ